MNQKPIADLAEVMVGLVLKRKEADPTTSNIYKYKALTLKSLNAEGWIDKDQLDIYESSENLDQRYLALEGDVLMKLTPPYTAVAIDKEIHGSVVPAQFIIIRIKGKRIIPGYLAFYLNANDVKREIVLDATGSSVAMLKTATIRELKIPILEMNKQQTITELSRLMVHERQLMSKLAETNEKYYQALTKSLIKEDK